MAGRGFYPEINEGMIAYVAGQIRAFFGRCVSGAFRPQLGRPGRHGPVFCLRSSARFNDLTL